MTNSCTSLHGSSFLTRLWGTYVSQLQGTYMSQHLAHLSGIVIASCLHSLKGPQALRGYRPHLSSSVLGIQCLVQQICVGWRLRYSRGPLLWVLLTSSGNQQEAAELSPYFDLLLLSPHPSVLLLLNKWVLWEDFPTLHGLVYLLGFGSVVEGFVLFWPYHKVCSILVLPTRDQTCPLQWKCRVLTISW